MEGDAQREATYTHMLSASTHILARLQRCHQTRRLLDSRLEQQFNRASTLRQAGKLAAVAEIEQEIAAYLARQKELGRTTDQTITALSRALREDLIHNGNNNGAVSVTIIVEGGTPSQKAQITDQVTRTVQKAVKTKVAPLLAVIPAWAAAAALPTTALLTLLTMGGLSSQAMSVEAGLQCSKTSGTQLALTQCDRKVAFPTPIVPPEWWMP